MGGPAARGVETEVPTLLETDHPALGGQSVVTVSLAGEVLAGAGHGGLRPGLSQQHQHRDHHADQHGGAQLGTVWRNGR